MSRIDETRDFVAVRIAVLTVSDTRKAADDVSGDTLAERLTDAGHVLAARGIVADDRAAIAGRLRQWIADPAVDVILTTGGTGLTGRDVTVEAHRDVYEKEIEAFGTVFTMVSMAKIGTSAVQSRAALSTRASRTRSSSAGADAITRRTSPRAVCCSSARVRSVVRCSSSSKSRAFAMAIAA